MTIRIMLLAILPFVLALRPAAHAQTLPAPLACPSGFSYQNGACLLPMEGQPNGTVFGTMYSTWHCPQAQDNASGAPIFDIARILAGQQPWGPYGAWFWKSEPTDGYYCLSRRDDILRKHAIELRDAGIRFVYIDASNHASANGAVSDRPAAMILEPMDAMLRVWSAIPGAPRVVPFVPVTNVSDPMIDAMMAKLSRYPQMQLMKDGKPFFLLAANPAMPYDQSKLSALAQKYSYRKMWHHAAGGFTADSWSFSSLCSNAQFNSSQGRASCNQPITQNEGPEHVSVSPAINAFIFSEPPQVTPRYGGRTFVRQFDTVSHNPTMRYATISDWNSWIAIGFCKKPDGGLSTNRAECLSSNYEFVDTFTDELSRDMEPTRSQGDYYYRLMKACIAKFQRGEPCNENSAAEVASMSFGAGLSDSVQRACTYPGSTNIPRLQVGEVFGTVDAISVQNNRAVLTGWACIVGSNSPIDLHVYLGGPAGKGTFKTALRTSLAAEPGVHTACQNGGSVLNRFALDVTDWMSSNPGQPIYVHGLNPVNAANYFLRESGHCSVPWPETASPQTGLCKITQSLCPNSPSTVGTFEDVWGEQNAGASSSPAACMQRATDYYNWCGGASKMIGQTTSATFYSAGVAVQTVMVGNSCKITQASCPNHASATGTFEDAWGDQNAGASSNPAACMQRATDYYNWCGGADAMNGQTTMATFYTAGTPTQTITVGAIESYKMSSASSNDVLWSASSSVDANVGTSYSSRGFSSNRNDRGSYLAAWLAGGAHTVSKLVLTARMQAANAIGFATQYDVYLTSPDNSRWQLIGAFAAKADAHGRATIQLPSSYSTYGVMIVPKVLGKDDYGNYYFQLAEIGLGR